MGIFSAEGSNLVLRGFELAGPGERLSLAVALRGLVGNAARSAHARHVVEEVLRQIGTEDAAFIVEELLAEGADLALNGNASSVLCRVNVVRVLVQVSSVSE